VKVSQRERVVPSQERGVNVLFTSGGRRVELLRAFRRAYRDLGLEGTIVVVDRDPLAPALHEASRAYVVPSIDDPAYPGELAEVCRSETIDLVFPLIDPDILCLATNRAAIESTGARVVVVPEESARIAADKQLTQGLFSDLGVPAPRTWTPEEARAGAAALPLFVKSRFGSAGEHAFPARTPRELDFFLDYVPDPLVQEWLAGPEITTDVCCDLQGNVMSVVSRKRIEVRSGEVAKGVTVSEPAIMEHCVAIAKGLAAIGPITIQCLLRDGEPRFTEVNARFGGGVPLGIAAGVRTPHWLLSLAAGLPVEVPPLGSYQVGLFISRFDDSFLLTEAERAKVASSRLRSR
jgi:carbamoyl-phosphate synthase large subunit